MIFTKYDHGLPSAPAPPPSLVTAITGDVLSFFGERFSDAAREHCLLLGPPRDVCSVWTPIPGLQRRNVPGLGQTESIIVVVFFFFFFNLILLFLIVTLFTIKTTKDHWRYPRAHTHKQTNAHTHAHVYSVHTTRVRPIAISTLTVTRKSM